MSNNRENFFNKQNVALITKEMISVKNKNVLERLQKIILEKGSNVKDSEKRAYLAVSKNQVKLLNEGQKILIEEVKNVKESHNKLIK